MEGRLPVVWRSIPERPTANTIFKQRENPAVYELTGAGERYLTGDLDAAHQPTPTVGRVLRG